MPPDAGEWEFPNRATPLGSPAYYAVRFTPEAQRRRHALLLGWRALIDEIADRPHDPGVARIKLDWWRNEIASLDGGQPRHPLLLALVDSGIDACAVTAMHQLIDAADMVIRTPQPADGQAFAGQCRATGGAFFTLLAIAAPESSTDADACREAGGYCAAVSRIQHLAEAPHWLPADTQPEALQVLDAEQRSARLDALLDRFALPDEPARQLPDIAVRLTALAAAIHRKMRRTRYPVIDTLVDRPPIAHLWTAWRSR